MALFVGWGDEDASSMASQYLDITDVADGEYIVLLEADLADEFLEVNEDLTAGTRVAATVGGVDAPRQ